LNVQAGDTVCYRSRKAGGHTYVTGKVLEETIHGVKVELDEFYRCLDKHYAQVREYVEESEILDYWEDQ